jgi:hypothetical protein
MYAQVSREVAFLRILWLKLHTYLNIFSYMLHALPISQYSTSCSATCAMLLIRVWMRCCESCTKHTLLSLKHDSKQKANKIKTHSTNRNTSHFYKAMYLLQPLSLLCFWEDLLAAVLRRPSLQAQHKNPEWSYGRLTIRPGLARTVRVF